LSQQLNICMKKGENKATTPRSFIRINNTEHNLIALVELLNQNGANIYNIICPESLPKSVIGIYGGRTLALSSRLEVGL